MSEEYETDQLLSGSGGDGEDPGEAGSPSFGKVTEEEVREGVSQDCREESARSSWSRRRIVLLCTAVRRSWFLRETVLLLRLAIPTVRPSTLQQLASLAILKKEVMNFITTKH